MEKTPKANRLHIALMGRTNVGKSSILNMLTGQDIAITSPVPGTTTDIVEKAMEILPLGPVLFLDTAGIDDTSQLASARLEKTRKIFNRADLILLITEADIWTDFEETILAQAKTKKIPVLSIVNKNDIKIPSAAFLEMLRQKTGHVLSISCNIKSSRNTYLNDLKLLIAEISPADFIAAPSIIGDLLPCGGLAVLVVPIDLQAPKGRLILPQVQTIRDALDNDAATLIVKERELSAVLDNLKNPPAIVVTDSQAVLKVTADVPPNIPVTTFSILFARQKGNLSQMARGAATINYLSPQDKILIAEACSHHALEDDIGRIKIPRWMRQYLGFDIQTDIFSGRDYPENLKQYKLIIHCGACMLTRREMLNRLEEAKESGTAITNYGVAISLLQGVIRRTLAPFPSALQAFEQEIVFLSKNED